MSRLVLAWSVQWLLTTAVHGKNDAILDMYAQAISGEATYYGKSPKGTSCQLGPVLPPVSGHVRSLAGVSATQYKGSRACGMCFKVEGSGRGKGRDPMTGEFLVMVSDVCPGCGSGGVDLAEDGDGRWGITLQAVQCPVGDTKIEYKFQGSDQWYLRLQVRNARIPLQSVHVRRGGEEVAMSHSSDGFWQLGQGKFYTPLQLRLTAVNDEELNDIIPSIVNDVVLEGENKVQFSLASDLP